MATAQHGKESGNGRKKRAENNHVDFEMLSGRQGVEENEKRKREEEKLRSKLHEHFKDPYTRICRNSGIKRFPEKVTLLILVWFFSTYQLILFGGDRAQFAKFVESNEISMKHLLLKEWSEDYETMPYPPSTGAYAIYTIEDLLEHINYTISNVYTLPETSVGSFFVRKLNDSENPVTMCLYYYNIGIYNETAEEIRVLDETRKTVCKDVGSNYSQDYGFNPSIEDLMRSTGGKLVR